MPDHTLIYCEYCKSNKMGVIDAAHFNPKCSVCGSRNTRPAQKSQAQPWRKAKRKAGNK